MEDKVAMLSKANRIMDVKARIVIIRYYKQEALFKILYLWTIKE
jgi:hypothetical protein